MTTNEQWLKSLDTEELANILNSNVCKMCANSPDGGENCSGKTCNQGVMDWLKQERIFNA